MYESPFHLYCEDIAIAAAEFIDGEVFKAAAGVGVTVDKEELLRALHYDRDQYDKGFNDGIMAAADELVRCKDCVHWRHNLENDTYCGCVGGLTDPEEDDFCSYGERRDEYEDY